MKKIKVPAKYDGKKISSFLLSNVENLSNNLFYKTLRRKDIKVNGKRINKDIIIYENDEILIYIADKLLQPRVKLDILYEDENIIVINKLYNIETVGKNSLTTLIQNEYKDSEIKPKK